MITKSTHSAPQRITNKPTMNLRLNFVTLRTGSGHKGKAANPGPPSAAVIRVKLCEEAGTNLWNTFSGRICYHKGTGGRS